MLHTEEWLAVSDSFYSAALDGKGWHGALERFANATGSRSGELIGLGSAHAVPFNWVTDLGQDWVDEFVAIGGGNPEINPFVRAGVSVPPLKVVSSGEFVTRKERRSSFFLADFARRHDIQHICLTPLIKEQQMLVGLAVIRSHQQGEISPDQRALFTSVAPHVRAAVRMQMALENQGALIMANALEALSLAVFICDRFGRVKAMTPAAERLISGGDAVRLRDGHLVSRHADESGALTDALAATAGFTRAVNPAFRTIPLRGLAGAPLILEVMPLPRQEFAFGFEPRALVVARGGQPDPDRLRKLLQMLYRLSAAETEVAISLADAESPEVIAAARSTSVGTVRAQIRAIYAKLGVNRLSELHTRINQLR